MPKTDIVVRTAQDLERKYNFASLLGLKKNIEITTQGIQKIENELNSMLNALVINLKDALDSQSEISLWFYSGMPTTKNAPYVDWENPADHIGDIYYDQASGRVYQWNGVWEVNVNADLIEAMAITNSEIDTSEDHERKVFFDTPTVPYSNGDWWIKEDGTLFICQISKKEGTYEEADFINSSNYVESIAEKIGEELKVLKGTVTVISENYAKFTDLATGGSTIISGDNIVTGSIKSENYLENTSGMKISLEDGSIDSKYFKTDTEGNMTSTGGTIGGFTIDEEKLYAYITVDYDYTEADLEKIKKHIMEDEPLTEEELVKYDTTGDGTVEINDYMRIYSYIDAHIDTTHPGKVEIDSTHTNGSVRILNGLEESVVELGLHGISTNGLNVGNMGMGYTEDFTELVEFNETHAYIAFYKTNGIVTISYQGEAKTHSANTLLFTLPEGYRPKLPEGQVQFYTTFVKNQNTYGTICIFTDSGDVRIGQISSTTNSGRVYFSVSYVAEDVE